MQIPKSFKKDLRLTYEGEMEVDDLIRKHNKFIQRLAQHQAKYKTHHTINDFDDFYQEACIHLVNALWLFDEEKSKDITNFVVYHIGVKLRNISRDERAQRRHPEKPCLDFDERINVTDSTSSNPELRCMINEASEQLTENAAHLIRSLVNNDGNFSESIREIMSCPSIRKRYGTQESSVKYNLRKKVFSEIEDKFSL